MELVKKNRLITLNQVWERLVKLRVCAHDRFSSVEWMRIPRPILSCQHPLGSAHWASGGYKWLHICARGRVYKADQRSVAMGAPRKHCIGFFILNLLSLSGLVVHSTTRNNWVLLQILTSLIIVKGKKIYKKNPQ